MEKTKTRDNWLQAVSQLAKLQQSNDEVPLSKSLFSVIRRGIHDDDDADKDDDDVANDDDDDDVKDDDVAKDNDADKEGDWTERDLHPRHLRPHSYLKLITPPGSSSS